MSSISWFGQDVTYGEQLVSNLQAPVFLSSSSFNDLGDIDAVVTRDVLVSYSTCYTETQPWTRTRVGQASTRTNTTLN